MENLWRKEIFSKNIGNSKSPTFLKSVAIELLNTVDLLVQVDKDLSLLFSTPVVKTVETFQETFLLKTKLGAKLDQQLDIALADQFHAGDTQPLLH